MKPSRRKVSESFSLSLWVIFFITADFFVAHWNRAQSNEHKDTWKWRHWRCYPIVVWNWHVWLQLHSYEIRKNKHIFVCWLPKWTGLSLVLLEQRTLGIGTYYCWPIKLFWQYLFWKRQTLRYWLVETVWPFVPWVWFSFRFLFEYRTNDVS